MSLSDFEAHLKERTPGFRCYACRDGAKEPAFLARVRNRVNLPAEPQDLATIDQLFGVSAPSLKQFYANHNGVLMYEDTHTTSWTGGKFQAAGIAFFPIRSWPKKSNKMRESLSAMGWSTEDMPEWLLKGIAFGEIPHSANYFVIPPVGKNAGKIFYADHDAFDPDPIAGSFDQFLDTILADPADFLYRLGCYTRYSDGTTEIQWIPKEYVAG